MQTKQIGLIAICIAQLAFLGSSVLPALATTPVVTFVESTYRATPGGLYGGGAQYVTSHFPTVSIEVKSDIELAQCVFVAYKNGEDNDANLSSDPILISDGRYKCQVDLGDLDYETDSQGYWTVDPLVYDINWERHDSPTMYGFKADFNAPTSRITRAEKVISENWVGAVVYFSADDGEGVGFDTIKVVYSKDGGPWTEAADTCHTAGNPTVGCDFFPTLNGGNGTYRLYSLATDWIGKKETKSPVAEATLTITEIPDEEQGGGEEKKPPVDEDTGDTGDTGDSHDQTTDSGNSTTESTNTSTNDQDNTSPSNRESSQSTAAAENEQESTRSNESNTTEVVVTASAGGVSLISATGIFSYLYIPAFAGFIKKITGILIR